MVRDLNRLNSQLSLAGPAKRPSDPLYSLPDPPRPRRKSTLLHIQITCNQSQISCLKPSNKTHIGH
eukprot:6841233-Pyramimonas_sp.AAC.1